MDSNPAAADHRVGPNRNDPTVGKFWLAVSQPGGAAKPSELFRAARKRDPNAFLFPETVVNAFGYEQRQRGQHQDAFDLFKLNAEAYPASANTQDSLADGYAALGQIDQALAAEQKCLELLPADKVPDAFKAQVRAAAEEKIAKWKRDAGK